MHKMLEERGTCPFHSGIEEGFLPIPACLGSTATALDPPYQLFLNNWSTGTVDNQELIANGQDRERGGRAARR